MDGLYIACQEYNASKIIDIALNIKTIALDLTDI